MKVLIVSKFFYPRGGACAVAIATKQLLESYGHTVRVFAMDYPENIKIDDDRDFASQVSFSGSIKDKIKGAKRTLGLGDVAKKARKVIEEFKPDVVHLHNVHSYLSPIAGEIAHKTGARVVWTLHDYKLLCPAYAFRRPDGTLCQECLKSKYSCLKHVCMKWGRIGTLMAALEAAVWNRKRVERFTDCFITPSKFMQNKMMEGRFPPDKITTICNFVDPNKLKIFEDSTRPKDHDTYFCYTGRLSEEKGVVTMLEAAAQANIMLKVAGRGPLMQELQQKYKTNTNIQFLGHLDAPAIASLLMGAKAAIIPSECYENNPLGVIESLCAGTPVIGANIAGIPELITPDNGILFTTRDTSELADILRNFDRRCPFDRNKIATKAYNDFSVETHYKKLMQAYASEAL